MNIKLYQGPTYLAIYVDSRRIGNFSPAEAKHLAHLLQNGLCTVEEIKDRHKLLGKTLRQWAQHFQVSPSALYDAAKRARITPFQEVIHRLPISQRPQALQELETKKKFDF